MAECIHNVNTPVSGSEAVGAMALPPGRALGCAGTGYGPFPPFGIDH